MIASHLNKLCFQQLKSENKVLHTYFICDAARAKYPESSLSRFVQMLDINPPQKWKSLYTGELAQDMENHAPYLVQLTDDAGCMNKTDAYFQKWLLEKSYGQAWGLYLRSYESFERLWSHIRKFSTAVTEDGKKILLRWHDPRIIHIYLNSLSREQSSKFFEHIQTINYEQEEAFFRSWLTKEGIKYHKIYLDEAINENDANFLEGLEPMHIPTSRKNFDEKTGRWIWTKQNNDAFVQSYKQKKIETSLEFHDNKKNVEKLYALGFTKSQNLNLLAQNLDKIFTHPRKEALWDILFTQDRYQDQRVDIIMRILENG